MSRLQSWLFLLAVSGLAGIGSALTGGCFNAQPCIDVITSFTSSANPSTVNQAVTFTANIKELGTPVSTVPVNFSDVATLLGTAQTDINGNAFLTISTLGAGQHTITASITGCGVQRVAQTVNAAGAPVITQVMTNTGPQGATITSVTITGQTTNFAQGTSVVSFSGMGITASNVMVASATSLTATLTILPNTPLGTQTVTVTTGAETASLPNGFTVTAGIPAIILVAPNSGQLGAMNLNVTITGQFTHFAQGTSVVNFLRGGQISTNIVTVASATSLTVTVQIPRSTPLGAEPVTVTTGAETATLINGFSVTATAPPIAVAITSPMTAQTIQQGQVLPFTATLANDPGNMIDWVAACPVAACGIFSTTPTASGASTNYTAPTPVSANLIVTVTASSHTDPTKSASLMVTVTATAPPIAVTITSPSSPQTIQQGQPLAMTAMVANDPANGGVNWTCSPTPCGMFSTTPTASGTATSYTAPTPVSANVVVTVTATSVSDFNKFATLMVTVTPPPISVTTISLPGGTAGSPYLNASVVATGGTSSYIWSETTATLLFDATTGQGISGACVGLMLDFTSTALMLPISGTPTTPGTCGPFTVQIKDSSMPQQSASSVSLSITILGITTTSLPPGNVGSSYSSSVIASGGTSSYTWSETTATLLFDATTGMGISGACVGLKLDFTSTALMLPISSTPTPTTAGTCGPFTVQIKDSSTPQLTASSVSLSITITAAPLAITTTSLPPGSVNASYMHAVMATGGTPPFTWTSSMSPGSSLPAGMMLDPATGILSGMPTTAGAYPIFISVKDSTVPAQPPVGTVYLLIISISSPPPACILNGKQHAFLFQGFDSGGMVATAGSFAVTATGDVMAGGEEDVNRASGVTSASIYATSPANSPACLMVDANEGRLILETSLGPTTYIFTADSMGTSGRLIEFDRTSSATPASGSGLLMLQDPTAFNLSSLSGNAVFGLSGNFLVNIGIPQAATTVRAAAAGQLNLDTMGSAMSGEMDLSTLKTSAFGSPVTSGALTLASGAASFMAPLTTTGRGTVMLIVPSPNPSNISGTLNFAYYIVKSQTVILVETDTRSTTVPAMFPVLSGLLKPQAVISGGFASLGTGSSLIFATQGVGQFGLGPAIGQILPDGMGNLTGTMDQSASATATSFTGTYTSVDTMGRTAMALMVGSPPRAANQVLYLAADTSAGAASGFVMDTPGSAVSFGELKQQASGTFSANSLNGTFRASSALPGTPGTRSEVGPAVLDGVGTSFDFTFNLDSGGTGPLQKTNPVVESYAVAANGRGTATPSSSMTPDFVYWIISPTVAGVGGEFVCLQSFFSSSFLLEFKQ